MNYATEKKAVDAKMKKLKRISFVVSVVSIIITLIFCAFVPPTTWKYHFHLPKIDARNTDELRMHFLDVGQGDCTLIELPDGKTLLIDGGKDESASTAVLRYLNALDVDVIDYLVLTHADADHCGGLTKVVENKQVSRAFLPKDSAPQNNEYAAFYKALTVQKECKVEYSSRAISLNGDGERAYTLSFLYPYSYEIEADGKNSERNEQSSVLWLDYQGVSALFTGDAPIETETLLMQDFDLGAMDKHVIKLDETEILKVSHHGSMDATSEAFLDFLNVKTAVISCGADNPYGHPTQEVLNRLNEREIATYRTDLQGSVVITVGASGTYEARTLGK